VDKEGHGTHTASTAAGRAVANASLVGVARGTARGAVPGARLAVYKVCWGDDGCASEDILAAFDDAIADGVDVVSASLGSDEADEYSSDAIAVGAFHAMRRGVVTSLSAGNSGPSLGTVSNVAPWAVSVAAVTTDRRIISEIVLGDGRRVVGNAVTAFPHLVGKPSLLVDPGSCGIDQLEGKRFKGAVLLCSDAISLKGFKETGADAVIRPSLFQDGNDTAFSYSIPAVRVTTRQFDDILDFYNSTRFFSFSSLPGHRSKINYRRLL
jgi:subtilisin family serine protease